MCMLSRESCDMERDSRAAMTDIAQRLRDSGKRMTLQRRFVLDALGRARHHTTAEEIATRVRRQHPQIDTSTVYRNLEALEELGYVTHTHFEDRVTRWHRADAERHGHLVCRSCGSESEVPMTLLEPLARRLRTELGFQADLAHSAVVGICRESPAVSSSGQCAVRSRSSSSPSPPAPPRRLGQARWSPRT